MTIDYKLVLISIIKRKVNTEIISDEDISNGIDEVEQYVLNYCCIPQVPFALRFVLANMTVDLLNYQYYKLNADEPKSDSDSDVIGIGDISNIQVGDTQVKLGNWSVADNKTNALKSHQANLDDVLFDYNTQLNQFRRIY